MLEENLEELPGILKVLEDVPVILQKFLKRSIAIERLGLFGFFLKQSECQLVYLVQLKALFPI